MSLRYILNKNYEYNFPSSLLPDFSRIWRFGLWIILSRVYLFYFLTYKSGKNVGYVYEANRFHFFFMKPLWKKSSCIIRVNLERDGVTLAFSCSFCTLHAEFSFEFVGLWIWITTDVRRPPCLRATPWKISYEWLWRERESLVIVYNILANNKSCS